MKHFSSLFSVMCLCLCLVMAAYCDQAPLVVPEASGPPPMDGKFDPSLWTGALKLDNFSTKEGPAQNKTELLLLRYGDRLYGAATLYGEDVQALVKSQETDKNKVPWQLNGMEIFFGNGKGAYCQTAIDYMGRVYKTFDAPVGMKVNYQKDSYTLRFFLPMKNIVRTAFAEDATYANFHRKQGINAFGPTTLSSWIYSPKGFFDLSHSGMLYFKKPEDIVSGMAETLKREVDTLAANDCITVKDADIAREKIAGTYSTALKSIGSVDKFIPALEAMREIADFTASSQLGRMREKYGEAHKKLLPRNSLATELHDAWKPAPFMGRDYWYMFTFFPDFISIDEKIKFMSIPVFRDSMFIFRWGQPGPKGFMPPDGCHYKVMQKYKNPFAVKTFGMFDLSPERARNLQDTFDPVFMNNFFDIYKDRFAGFYGDEALVGGDGAEGLKKSLRYYKYPEPKNRMEAYEAVKKLYNHSSDKFTPPPFRNLHNLTDLTRKYVGNGMAGPFNHIIMSYGDTMSGNEIGECIPGTNTLTMFARGAARQYGKPWRHYQIYYSWRYLFEPGHGGLQCSTSGGIQWGHIDQNLTPECRSRSGHGMNGLYCGLSIDRQKETWLRPYLNGVGIWCSEGDTDELFSAYDLETIGSVDPLVVNLRDQKIQIGEMAKMNIHFYDNIVKKRDRGVTVTPIAFVFDRYHGYLPLYFQRRVWGYFNPTEGEKMMWALDSHVFKCNKDNAAYSTSKFGEIFDVITNDAGQTLINTYKVMLPVGDVTFDKPFAERLVKYVKNGGTLILNAGNLKNNNPFPKDFLGCALTDSVFQSKAFFSRISSSVIKENSECEYTLLKPEGAEILAVTADSRQAPVVTSQKYGKGHVIVAAPHFLKLPGSFSAMMKLFDELISAAAGETVPIKVKTPMQYQINRNKTGWIVYLQNNFGIPPSAGIFKELPKVDYSKKASAEITVPESLGAVAKVIDWWSGKDIPFKTSKLSGRGDTVVETTLQGGDCQALEFVME